MHQSFTAYRPLLLWFLFTVHPQLPHPPPPLPTPPPPPPPPPSFGYPLLFQVACDAKLLGVTTSLLVNGQMVDANVCVIGHTVYLGIYIGKLILYERKVYYSN